MIEYWTARKERNSDLFEIITNKSRWHIAKRLLEEDAKRIVEKYNAAKSLKTDEAQLIALKKDGFKEVLHHGTPNECWDMYFKDYNSNKDRFYLYLYVQGVNK